MSGIDPVPMNFLQLHGGKELVQKTFDHVRLVHMRRSFRKRKFRDGSKQHFTTLFGKQGIYQRQVMVFNDGRWKCNQSSTIQHGIDAPYNVGSKIKDIALVQFNGKSLGLVTDNSLTVGMSHGFSDVVGDLFSVKKSAHTMPLQSAPTT